MYNKATIEPATYTANVFNEPSVNNVHTANENPNTPSPTYIVRPSNSTNPMDIFIGAAGGGF